MKLKSIIFVVLLGLWTAFTLGGSIWGFIFMRGPNSVTRLNLIPLDNIPTHLIVTFSIFLCGGGLWGLGIARLMNSDVKSMVKACAISWSGTVFTVYMVVGSLGFSRINILPHFLHSVHYNFLSIFVPVIGIITAINTYVVTGKLGFKEFKKSVGIYTGLAAALGFLGVALTMFYGFGWEVGYPVPGKYGMLLILLICIISAALAGGASLGWILSRAGSTQESQMENMQA
jgi:hypothetical protein